MKKFVTILALLVGFAVLVTAAQRESTSNEQNLSSKQPLPKQGATTSAPSNPIGLVSQQAVQNQRRTAYIDPKTGELTSTPPTIDTQLQSNRAVESDITPTQEIRHANGMVEIILNGQLQSTLSATVNCDGTLVQQHSEIKTVIKPAKECAQ